MFVELIFQFPSQLDETLQHTYGLAQYSAALFSIILSSKKMHAVPGILGVDCVVGVQGCNVIKAGANPPLAATYAKIR